MSEYTTRQGDTFEIISRNVYGTPENAKLLRAANADVSEPIPQNIKIIIPPQPNKTKHKIAATNKDEVSVLIDGKVFKFWTDLSIRKEIDTLTTISLSVPFDAANTAFRAFFKPLSFPPITIYVGGDIFFNGTVVGVSPTVTPTSKTVILSAYSTPGVLNDCCLPASILQREFDDQALDQIANSVAAVFGIEVVFEGDPGAVFERLSLNPGDKLLGFLTELAKQRNFIMGDLSDGSLRFFKPEIAPPSAFFVVGQSPLTDISVQFNPQNFYSHITGLATIFVGLDPEQYTVRNAFATVQRPFVFEVPDVETGDLKQAVESKLGRMLADVVTYTAEVSTWRDAQGVLWETGATVNLHAPDAMVYNPYDFIISGVDFRKTAVSTTATLNLTLPGAYTGVLPGSLPWG